MARYKLNNGIYLNISNYNSNQIKDEEIQNEAVLT